MEKKQSKGTKVAMDGRISFSGRLRLMLPRMPVSASSVLVVFVIFSAPVFAESTGSATTRLDYLYMAMGLTGGLAFFLFGLEQMATTLRHVAGARLKNILARLTANRFTGAISGAIVTAILQSSSMTTVLVVGFISADVLSLSQAVGIILGANIGSTITSQIIAFKVSEYALLLVSVGIAISLVADREKVRGYGIMCMGLGLVFFGMGLMSETMEPLRTYGPFLDFIEHMETPILDILTATVFTGLIQSSAATVGIAIAMASQGLITLPAGIALIFGANIGTCITALLASVGKPRKAVRASLVHVVVNVLGVILWVGLIDHLAQGVMWLSPVVSGLTGTDKLAAETPRQIANAHTTFNVINSLIFLPFAPQLARLVESLLPDKPETGYGKAQNELESTAQHLHPALLAVPAVALGQARAELRHMASTLSRLLVLCWTARTEFSEQAVGSTSIA